VTHGGREGAREKCGYGSQTGRGIRKSTRRMSGDREKKRSEKREILNQRGPARKK